MINSPLFMAAAAATGYNIPYSLRLRRSNSAYLTRTPGVAATDSTKWTVSIWCKRGTLGADGLYYSLINAEPGAWTHLAFINDALSFQVNDGGVGRALVTSRLFRDPSAWYHIVAVWDRANATAAQKMRLYVNGVEATSFTTDNRASISGSANPGWHVNGTVNTISKYPGGASGYFDGAIEITSIDGQVLTPDAFGETDAVSGNWVPKQYTGTYGANGFYPDFADATSTTTIGYDTSGNGNNWTTSGISVTADPTFDQLTDTPTNNYATLDPNNRTDVSAALANANMAYTGGNNRYAASTIHMTSGKWYIESGMTGAPSTGQYCFGVSFRANAVGANADPGFSSDTHALYAPTTTGNRGYWTNSAQVFNIGSSFDQTKINRLAIDIDAGKAWLGQDAVFYSSAGATTGDPAAGTNPTFTFTPGTPAWVVIQTASSNTGWVNFGQQPFVQTAPTGFLELSSANVASVAVSTSGSFTGNADAFGPAIWTNGNPATLTINGNAVTFGTHADKTAGGFKLRTSNASYNTAGTNNWTATAGNRFVASNAVSNNAQVNP